MLASMFLDSQTNSSKSVFFSSATTEYGINRTPRYNGLSHRWILVFFIYTKLKKGDWYYVSEM